MGEIILCGDFNSRTGTLQEKFEQPEEGAHLDYIDSEDMGLPTRFNSDNIVNTFGRELLSVMNDSNLMFVNGRKIGDSCGDKTCYKYNGSSVVDYFITTETLFDDIISFKVENQTWYSDHSPISTVFRVARSLHSEIIEENLEPFYKYVWSEEGGNKYCDLLRSDTVQNQLKNILVDMQDSVSALKSFKGIIKGVADESLQIKQCKRGAGKLKKPLEIKLGNDYKTLQGAKQTFNKLSRKVKIDRTIDLARAKRQYKSVKYTIFKTAKEKQLLKLAQLEGKDPKNFWNSVKKIISPGSVSASRINAKSWVDYFKGLLNIKASENSPFLDYISSSFKHN